MIYCDIVKLYNAAIADDLLCTNIILNISECSKTFPVGVLINCGTNVIQEKKKKINECRPIFNYRPLN